MKRFVNLKNAAIAFALTAAFIAFIGLMPDSSSAYGADDYDEEALTSTSDGAQVLPDMSNVILSADTLYLIDSDYYYAGENDENQVTFYNAPYVMSDYNTALTVTSSNPSFVPGYNLSTYLTDNVLTFNTEVRGVTTLTVTLNGASYNITLISGYVSMKDSILMQKGTKYTLKVSQDFAGQYYIPAKAFKWSSTDATVARVSGSGVFKAKKTGNAIIYADYGSARLGCAVSVATKKTITAIKKAIRIGKTCTYSQPYRMKKGYYDCSSLTWRAYKAAGVTLVSRYYAATAAEQARWLVVTKGNKWMKFTSAGIKKMKYNAGDLGFNAGYPNGRYKGIYHVEMFIGYRYCGYYKGKPSLTPRWANRSDGYYTTNIVHFNDIGVKT